MGVLKPDDFTTVELDTWMLQALEEARSAESHSDVPVGALVVHHRGVIAARHNERELTGEKPVSGSASHGQPNEGDETDEQWFRREVGRAPEPGMFGKAASERQSHEVGLSGGHRHGTTAKHCTHPHVLECQRCSQL